MTPVWKVYRDHEYRAAVKYPEDAAALVAALGDGTVLRHGHGRIVWREGSEEFPAGESYDRFADVVTARAARP